VLTSSVYLVDFYHPTLESKMSSKWPSDDSFMDNFVSNKNEIAEISRFQIKNLMQNEPNQHFETTPFE